MCIEAAYYGTPVIATRPIDCYYMEWLFQKCLAEKSSTVSEALEKAEEIIYQKAKGFKKTQLAKARKIFEKMKFPLDKITKVIMDTTKT